MLGSEVEIVRKKNQEFSSRLVVIDDDQIEKLIKNKPGYMTGHCKDIPQISCEPCKAFENTSIHESL